MSGSQQLLFFKEWASYLKRGELRNIETVLRRSPANPNELAFLLEVISHLCMMKTLEISSNHELPRLQSSELPNFVSFSSVQHLLTADYLNSLIEIHGKTNFGYSNHSLSSILIAVIAKSNCIENDNAIGKSFRCLRFIGKLYYLLDNDPNIKQDTFLKDIRDSWTSRKLIGPDWREPLVNLLILWSGQQAKMQQMRDNKVKIEDLTQSFLGEWYDIFEFLIVNCSIVQKNLEDDHAKLCLQVKMMAKNLRLKLFKDKKMLLLQFKRKMLENTKKIRSFQQKSIIFGYYFTVISVLCNQIDQKIEKVVTIQDLINQETLFYSCFWKMFSMDHLQYFSQFSSFMRSFSQYNILSIYQKINCNVAFTELTLQQSPQSIISLVQTHNYLLFKQFNIRPVATAKILLQYYLFCSGIPLPKNQKSYNNKKNRLSTIIPIVTDPLHFLMISRRFWQDSFHRDVLEIALWMSLDSYCKWIERQSLREISEKEMQQYLKKLNIAIAIFFFSLEHPTRLLQYQPVECDCLKELFVQPIFPTLVLNCNYFFNGYHWQARKILNKVDNGLQNWVLPWAHLLAIPKNMLHFIYLERGYELAHRIATQNRANFDRVFGDFFTTRILTELQGFGINLANGQAEGKQKIGLIQAQRKKYMIMLLKESEKGGEKANHTARRILQILI